MNARPPTPRTANLAVLVPVLGLFLWLPPFVGLFSAPLRVFGIPLIVAYLFGVWVVLVAVACRLASQLDLTDAEATPAEGASPGPPAL